MKNVGISTCCLLVIFKDIPVLNPGDWFGKTWLFEIGGSYSPLLLAVEADSITDAIDVVADSPQYGHLISVSPEDVADYDPDSCHYGPSGQMLDLDHVMVYGREGSQCPFPCRYFGEQLPQNGMLPTEYWQRDDE